MLKNLSIRVRLIYLVLSMSLLLIAIGIYGLVGIAHVNNSLKTVYDDRLVALGQLDRVSRAFLRTQLQIALSVSPSHKGVPVEEIDKTIAGLHQDWEAYNATYLTSEEQELAKAVQRELVQYEASALRPALAALRQQELASAEALLRGPITTAYFEVRKPLMALLDLQLREAKAEYERSQTDFHQRRLLSIIVIALGVLGSSALAMWVIQSISTPLNRAVGFARSVAEGNLAAEIDVHAQDETGRLIQSLSDMRSNLSGIVTQVRSGTDAMADAVEHLARGNLDLSSRTEEQASSLEQTASSMEQLTATVKQNADNARHAKQLASEAADAARLGGDVVGQVVSTMSTIRESSGRIVDIITVIDGISFQTNILALNAAVEAARAGDQGRGFAVVAGEVRTLAHRSAAAAKEIKTLINDSVANVNAGDSLVNQAGAAMQEIVTGVQRVTDIMSDISRASDEQTVGIEQVNEAITQLDSVTQQNASLVEEATSAANALRAQAAGLQQAVSVFVLGAAPPAAAPRRALAIAAPHRRTTPQ
jgi:methyl-accepting chemotaxis protein-1 (serine sensor receptor)